MENKKIKIILFNRLGFFCFLLALLPAYLFNSVFNPITIILVVVGTILSILFRCPYCKTQLDPRLRASELEYCPKCGHKLYEKKASEKS